MADRITAVEAGFRAQAAGHTVPSAVLGVHVGGGGFHIKAAGLARAGRRVAIKMNANFPGNPERGGLPTIQGVIALFDGEDGRVLAVMDSMEITALRTAAATGVAANLMARPTLGRRRCAAAACRPRIRSGRWRRCARSSACSSTTAMPPARGAWPPSWSRRRAFRWRRWTTSAPRGRPCRVVGGGGGECARTRVGGGGDGVRLHRRGSPGRGRRVGRLRAGSRRWARPGHRFRGLNAVLPALWGARIFCGDKGVTSAAY